MKSLEDLQAMPRHAPSSKMPTDLNQVADMAPILTPTEVDHYHYNAPSTSTWRPPAKTWESRSEVRKIVAATRLPPNIRIDIRGLVNTMNASFRSFGLGLRLSILPVFLVLVASFDVHRSFSDCAGDSHGPRRSDAYAGVHGHYPEHLIPHGIVMLTGMVVSNRILIVDFANRPPPGRLRSPRSDQPFVPIRLRPILMTSLATIVGLLPMALKLEAGSESYAPLARVIIGGLIVSVALTIFVVPAAYLLIYQRRAESPTPFIGRRRDEIVESPGRTVRFHRC